MMIRGGQMFKKIKGFSFPGIILCMAILMAGLVAIPVSAATDTNPPPGNFEQGTFIRGTITAVSDDSITITDNSTEVTVIVDSSTTVTLYGVLYPEVGQNANASYDGDTMIASRIMINFFSGFEGDNNRRPGNQNTDNQTGPRNPFNSRDNQGPGMLNDNATMIRGTIDAISQDSITVTGGIDGSTSVTCAIDEDTKLPPEGLESLEAGQTVTVFYDEDTMIALRIMKAREFNSTDNQTEQRPQNMGNQGTNPGNNMQQPGRNNRQMPPGR